MSKTIKERHHIKGTLLTHLISCDTFYLWYAIQTTQSLVDAYRYFDVFHMLNIFLWNILNLKVVALLKEWNILWSKKESNESVKPYPTILVSNTNSFYLNLMTQK